MHIEYKQLKPIDLEGGDDHRRVPDCGACGKHRGFLPYF